MRFLKLAVLMMQLWICNAERLTQMGNSEMEMLTERILELNGIIEDLNIKVAIQHAKLEEIENRRMEIEMGKNQPKKLWRMKRGER